MGSRIRRVRISAGLRQWQLANLLGTTQPSICMYERGVLPDPLRLLRIARIGGTTVEWILTGHHWESGAETMERVPARLYELATLFHGVIEDRRALLESATETIRVAVAAVEAGASARMEDLNVGEIARHLGVLPREDRRALSRALVMNRAVSLAFMARGLRRMQASAFAPREPESGEAEGASPEDSLPPVLVRTNSLEPLKGPFFRVDSGLLLLRSILGDRKLRAEFERDLARMSRKLRGGRLPSRPRRAAAR
ncbi:MAG TPA: helix-turn-helix transcriptional regulator [Candidatus Saccharimonadales bacterium]|nr:helix-turn-helix transcriptional regulator [Candidatus Saccharimonadales bacterium]